jgi:hypothetical protein
MFQHMYNIANIYRKWFILAEKKFSFVIRKINRFSIIGTNRKLKEWWVYENKIKNIFSLYLLLYHLLCLFIYHCNVTSTISVIYLSGIYVQQIEHKTTICAEIKKIANSTVPTDIYWYCFCEWWKWKTNWH